MKPLAYIPIIPFVLIGIIIGYACWGLRIGFQGCIDWLEED